MSKEYKKRVALRRTMQELRRIIDSGERLKATYIEKAKKAKAGGSLPNYQIARSGLKTTMMQVTRAEQMLTNLELAMQHADFAKLSRGFVIGMNSACKELIKAARSMNFEKAEKIFNKAMERNETAGIKTEVYLANTGAGFAQATLSDAIDSEIDKTIGRFVVIDEENEEKAKLDELLDSGRQQAPAYVPSLSVQKPPEENTAPPKSTLESRTPNPEPGITNPAVSGDALRPQTMADFKGQTDVEKKLPEKMFYAKSKGETLPHVFIYGQKGLGKTTIAQIIANEMGGKLHDIHSGTIINVERVIEILKRIKQNDVLLIDEIHMLNADVQTALLKPIEDFEFTALSGKGKSFKQESFKIPKFTMIGATTDNGKVSGPLVDRLRKIELRLEPYSPEFLAGIIKNALFTLDGVSMTSEDLLDLAKRCRGTPRIAINFSRSLVAKAAYNRLKVIDKRLLSEFYEQEGVDELGLLKQDRELLYALITKFKGGPTGIETLANAIGDKKGNVVAETEPFLNRLGMISVVSGGRVAMDAAYKHLGLSRDSVQAEPEKEEAEEDVLYDDEDDAVAPSGNPAECAVADNLAALPECYKAFNDLLLRSNDGRTFQLDHVVVSAFGVFVIETKNYSGVIEGYRNAEFLKQTKGANSKLIYNPLKQNEGHIRALFETMGEFPYFSIAAFSDYAELHVSDTNQVCNARDICKCIAEYTDTLIDKSDVEKIVDAIKAATLEGEEHRAAHIARVREIREKKKRR
ncbi:MAG: NERD domain-containing protein [Firmicutes bacterium]|nr:NERD domain-containing protein [Bacillota bacterium]